MTKAHTLEEAMQLAITPTKHYPYRLQIPALAGFH